MSLIAFGFDGTLTASYPTVLLGREYGRVEEIRGLVEQGLHEEMAYAQTLRQRVSLLEGMPEKRVDAALEQCTLRSGAAGLIAGLHRSDIRVAIITGSFARGVEAALDQAGVTVDHVVASRLVIENDAVTGDVEGPLLDEGKDQALEEVALTEGVDLGQTIAIGYGVPDIPMLRAAGTAIGFNPEPDVEEYCDIDVTSMRKLQVYFASKLQ